jgi:hypothetical protein
MVDPQQVEDRRVEIMYVHRVFGDVVAEVIGRAVIESAFHSAACHPNREAAWMVIASKPFAATL